MSSIQVRGTRYDITKHAKKRLEQRFFKRRVTWSEAVNFVIGWQNQMHCVWKEADGIKLLITCYPIRGEHGPSRAATAKPEEAEADC